MKNTLKIEKGITLITLIITVLILVIITSAMAVNSHNSNELSKITKLQNDINALESRVASYFVEFDELPIYGNSYTKNEILSIVGEISVNDGDEYYIIDLSKLDNVTLNYGLNYLTQTNDKYIINEESHIIYYLNGISYLGQTYYTTGNLQIEKNEN